MAPRLLHLELRSVEGLVETAFTSISKLACLCKLDLESAFFRKECLALLALGPCRRSLHRVELRHRNYGEEEIEERIEDRIGISRIFFERFDSCDLVFD